MLGMRLLDVLVLELELVLLMLFGLGDDAGDNFVRDYSLVALAYTSGRKFLPADVIDYMFHKGMCVELKWAAVKLTCEELAPGSSPICWWGPNPRNQSKICNF
jgi:hypothetical protein